MAAAINSKNVLQILWREKLDLSKVGHDDLEALRSPYFIEQLIHATYNGSTQNVVFLKHLNEGLVLQIFPPVTVIEGVTKLALGKKLKCYISSLDVIGTCATLLRKTNMSTAPQICQTISRATFWLLENTIEIYKLLYSCMKDETMLSPDPDLCVQVIHKSQDMLNSLICDNDYEDLNYIGKLLFGEDEVSALQMQIRDLLSFQLDKITSHSLYGSFEMLLKQFMKLITRFLNASSMLSQTGKTNSPVPCQSLHTFIQFQVLAYLSSTSIKMAGLFDNFLKLESLPLDQMFVDLYRFTVNNVLIRKNTFEIQAFTAFMFIKLPTIFHHLEQKYKHQNGEQSILFLAMQQIIQISHEDLDVSLGCDSFKMFVTRCHSIKALDSKQMDLLLKSHINKPETADNIVNKLILLIKKCEDILKNISLTIEDNRDKVAQELQTLLNMPDLLLVLITFSVTDVLPLLLAVLLRINKFAERPKDTKDSNADQRADLFNNTFLLLCYIDAVFGDKVFIDVPSGLHESFFNIWRKKCTRVTSRKMYTQALFDKIMEPMIQSYHLPVSQAQWDEYCWSVGMIIKELTQAHLRRHFTTDALQKVCEGFKNKRPALCICAMVWLCTQYKTMPTSERVRTAKIINLFKRPHPNAARAAIWTHILQKYSVPLESDLLAANTKNKNVVLEAYVPGKTKMANLLSTRNLLIDQSLMNKVSELHTSMGFPLFAESIVMLILESGKEEESQLYESIVACLILMKPIEIIQEIFLRTLKTLFHSANASRLFADPQGLILCKCLSKAFASSVILYSQEEANYEMARPSKMLKLSETLPNNREILCNTFAQFLQDTTSILSTNQQNAVTIFILNMIQHIAMATTNLKQPIKFKEEIVTGIFSQLPPSIGRDTVTMLCDLSSKKGQELAATFLLKNSNLP